MFILPRENMTNFYFFSACFFGFLTTIYAEGHVNSSCVERETAIALLETAENLLTQAGVVFPSCNETANSTDESGCGGKKHLAYIEISKRLIYNVRNNFPTCSKEDKEDKDEKEDKDDEIVEENAYGDCSELFEIGHKKSGVYTIWVGEHFQNSKPLKVYCDMETDKGGWTVLQRRGKFPVQQDFNQYWEPYEKGFGNLKEEFWLGNENIYFLCSDGCEIRFDLKDEKGEKGFALYQSFKVSDITYRLSISGYSGNVGDGMEDSDRVDFSTKDRGHLDKARSLKGGWWYGKQATNTNLNGIYKPGSSNESNVIWYTWRKYKNLGSVEIKVRPT